MILNDWLRGKIPYFIPPPASLSLPASSHCADALRAPTQHIEEIPVHSGFVSEEDSHDDQTHLQGEKTDFSTANKCVGEAEKEETENGTESINDSESDRDTGASSSPIADRTCAACSEMTVSSAAATVASDSSVSPSACSEVHQQALLDWDTLYTHVVEDQQSRTPPPLPSIRSSAVSATSQPPPNHVSLRRHVHPPKRRRGSLRPLNPLENQSVRRGTKRRKGKRKAQREEVEDFEVVPLEQSYVHQHKLKRQRFC
jgi:hypothetical protein